MLVSGDEENAQVLLQLVDVLPFVTVVAENFVSHLATRDMECKALWVEERKAG
jgi:hypothetical protein